AGRGGCRPSSTVAAMSARPRRGRPRRPPTPPTPRGRPSAPCPCVAPLDSWLLLLGPVVGSDPLYAFPSFGARPGTAARSSGPAVPGRTGHESLGGCIRDLSSRGVSTGSHPDVGGEAGRIVP